MEIVLGQFGNCFVFTNSGSEKVLMETKLSELNWWLLVLDSAMREELAKKDRRSDEN